MSAPDQPWRILFPILESTDPIVSLIKINVNCWNPLRVRFLVSIRHILTSHVFGAQAKYTSISPCFHISVYNALPTSSRYGLTEVLDAFLTDGVENAPVERVYVIASHTSLRWNNVSVAAILSRALAPVGLISLYILRGNLLLSLVRTMLARTSTVYCFGNGYLLAIFFIVIWFTRYSK